MDAFLSTPPLDMCMPHNFTFPWRLHDLLNAANVEGFESIVSWLPNGRSFKVHDPKTFVHRVMKKFFNQNKYKSFQRQLNIWGFTRIIYGPNKGGYTHIHLVQGQPELCELMKREKIKGTGSARSVLPEPTKDNAMVAFSRSVSLSSCSSPSSSPEPSSASTSTSTSLSVPSSSFPSSPSKLSPLSLSKSSMSTLGQCMSSAVKTVSMVSMAMTKTVTPASSPTKTFKVAPLPPPTAVLKSEPQTGDPMLFEGRMFFFLEEAFSSDNPKGSPMDDTQANCHPSFQLFSKIHGMCMACACRTNTINVGIDGLSSEVEMDDMAMESILAPLFPS